MPKQTIVWLDQQEARIFQLRAEGFNQETIHAPDRHVHRHPKGASEAKDHPADAQHFFHDVAQSLEGSDEILVVGPGTAKLHFLKYAHEHDHSLAPRIVGIETVDHPSSAQLVAHARAYFSP